MTVIDFWLARLSEREAKARKASQPRWKLWGMQVRADVGGDSDLDKSVFVAHTGHEDGLRTFNAQHIAANDPAAVLADCQAKRRIVEMYRTESDLTGRSLNPGSDGRLGALADVIQTLAAVYADHEDWNPDWSVSE